MSDRAFDRIVESLDQPMVVVTTAVADERAERAPLQRHRSLLEVIAVTSRTPGRRRASSSA